jgi:hypothetical protein
VLQIQDSSFEAVLIQAISIRLTVFVLCAFPLTRIFVIHFPHPDITSEQPIQVPLLYGWERGSHPNVEQQNQDQMPSPPVSLSFSERHSQPISAKS